MNELILVILLIVFIALILRTAAWTTIPDSAIDADSPLTEDLMTDLRDNDEYLKNEIETKVVWDDSPNNIIDGFSLANFAVVTTWTIWHDYKDNQITLLLYH